MLCAHMCTSLQAALPHVAQQCINMLAVAALHTMVASPVQGSVTCRMVRFGSPGIPWMLQVQQGVRDLCNSGAPACPGLGRRRDVCQSLAGRPAHPARVGFCGANSTPLRPTPSGPQPPLLPAQHMQQCLMLLQLSLLHCCWPQCIVTLHEVASMWATADAMNNSRGRLAQRKPGATPDACLLDTGSTDCHSSAD